MFNSERFAIRSTTQGKHRCLFQCNHSICYKPSTIRIFRPLKAFIKIKLIQISFGIYFVNRDRLTRRLVRWFYRIYHCWNGLIWTSQFSLRYEKRLCCPYTSLPLRAMQIGALVKLDTDCGLKAIIQFSERGVESSTIKICRPTKVLSTNFCTQYLPSLNKRHNVDLRQTNAKRTRLCGWSKTRINDDAIIGVKLRQPSICPTVW